MAEKVLAFTGGATEATLADVLAAIQGHNQVRLDYVGGPTPEDPVYIGIAPYTSLDTANEWEIRKFHYQGTQVEFIEYRPNTSWNNRTNPTPGWNS